MSQRAAAKTSRKVTVEDVEEEEDHIPKGVYCDNKLEYWEGQHKLPEGFLVVERFHKRLGLSQQAVCDAKYITPV